MLIRFVVSNFLSFKEETEFNMLAGSFKNHAEHVYNIGKLNVLKSAAIYGANGAGKSNLVKAIDLFQGIVKSGRVDRTIEQLKFRLDESYANKPITLEAEFSIGKKIYSYGISLQGKNVSEEWLYESRITKEDKLLFERKLINGEKTSIKMADKYKQTNKEKLLIELMEENLLKREELLLGKQDTLNIKEITDVKKWITNGLIIIYPESKFEGLVPSIVSEEFNEFANDLLRTLDTGVKGLNVVNLGFDEFIAEYSEAIKKDILQKLTEKKILPFLDKAGAVLIIKNDDDKINVLKVISLHNNESGKDIRFELSEESDGTQRLLDLIPAFDSVLHYEQTFIIDEIDRSIHTSLLKSLIRKIMDNKSTRGQIIFTTHESNLLDMDIFRQDEIWFAEKDKKTSETKLYSLSEFKPRYDLDIRKGYLNGRFGAIPFLANLEDLNWNIQDA